MQRDLSKTFFEELPRYVADGLVATSFHPGGKLSIYNYTTVAKWRELGLTCLQVVDSARPVSNREFCF